MVAALLAFGWILVPGVAPIAPASVLIAYAVLAHGASVIARGNPDTPWVTSAFGLVSAVGLVPSLLVEYFGRTVNNGLMVAIVFALWFLSGAVAARLTGRIRDAVLSSTLSAQIGSLANVGAILTTYYVLRGSSLQDRFFRTEGTYQDFVRSGSGDFGAFVIGDLFGGAFFHLLLGGLAGALLGTIGGTLTVGVIHGVKRSSTTTHGTRLHSPSSSADSGRG